LQTAHSIVLAAVGQGTWCHHCMFTNEELYKLHLKGQPLWRRNLLVQNICFVWLMWMILVITKGFV